MIYKKFGNFIAVAESALSGFAFQLGQIDFARHSKSFYMALRQLYRVAADEVRQIKKINFNDLALNRAWIYVYALMVILAPFSNTNVAAAPSMPKIELQEVEDPRVTILRDFLNDKNSILAPYAQNFVSSADKYGVDWRLLVAISANESGYARRYVPRSYNAYGWGGGYMRFTSWEEGIEVINRDIAAKYYKNGPLTMDQFARIYSGQPSYRSWGVKITRFMNQISTHKLASR